MERRRSFAACPGQQAQRGINRGRKTQKRGEQLVGNGLFAQLFPRGDKDAARDHTGEKLQNEIRQRLQQRLVRVKRRHHAEKVQQQRRPHDGGKDRRGAACAARGGELCAVVGKRFLNRALRRLALVLRLVLCVPGGISARVQLLGLLQLFAGKKTAARRLPGDDRLVLLLVENRLYGLREHVLKAHARGGALLRVRTVGGGRRVLLRILQQRLLPGSRRGFGRLGRTAAEFGENAVERVVRVLVQAASGVFQQRLGLGKRLFKFQIPVIHEKNPFFRYQFRRWRTASYRRMAAAAEALSDEILPFMGMLTRKSHPSRTRRVMPSPSEPMTMAAGPLRSAS